jgi:SAM-dependent methyltransferase
MNPDPFPSRASVDAAPAQRTLAQHQIEAFYHDHFVAAQVADFVELLQPSPALAVLDVGGGCGHFAEALARGPGCRARVLDADPVSVAACRERGVAAEVGDALAPPARGDDDVVCFNLILHHLVGSSEAATAQLQRRALAAWRGRSPRLFVNEYIYDAVVGDLSGRLIYAITHRRLLSAAARAVSRFVPSLRANTFGVGVRFRSHASWQQLFAAAGLRVVAERRGAEEQVSLARRRLLIRSCRRDSFLLAFDSPAPADAMPATTR